MKENQNMLVLKNMNDLKVIKQAIKESKIVAPIILTGTTTDQGDLVVDNFTASEVEAFFDAGIPIIAHASSDNLDVDALVVHKVSDNGSLSFLTAGDNIEISFKEEQVG